MSGNSLFMRVCDAFGPPFSGLGDGPSDRFSEMTCPIIGSIKAFVNRSGPREEGKNDPKRAKNIN